MKLKLPILFTALCVLLSAVTDAQTTKIAADLIGQAHKHDNMYTLGPEASRQKAISLYQSALTGYLGSYCVTGAVYGTHPVLNFNYACSKRRLLEGYKRWRWNSNNGSCVKQ